MTGFLRSVGRQRLWLLGLLLWLGGLAGPLSARAQGKYMTKTGLISFFSASIMEDIEARNNKVAAVLDLATGQLAFAVPIREFQFKRTLMQEHFNENYMESEKYPKATFTGQVINAAQVVKLLPTGAQNVEVEGQMTMHGVSHGQLIVFAYFNIAPADYAIDIPLLVREHIAKSVSVRVNLTCDAVTPAVVSQP
jgi:hypothetical protein